MFAKQNKTPAFRGQRDNSILLLGTDPKGRELWMDSTMLKRHVLVSGTTGAGKSELLFGMIGNAMAWGGGGIFVDGKGDIASYERLCAVAKEFGREGDLYVLNFLTGGAGTAPQSNSVNPFASMSSDAIVQLLAETMDDAGGDGAMWRGRSVAMLTGIIRALVWLRDAKSIPLGIEQIRDELNLRRIIDLANQEHYPDMPHPVRKSIQSYLGSLPGFREEQGYKQSQTTLDQHGYLEMQLTKTLGSMADVYGHIFNSEYSDIDLLDVIRKRRILLVLLPALEKSVSEVEFLARLVVAMIRHMAASHLATIDNDFVELTTAHFVSPRPFLCVFDEASHYLTSGMDTLVSQSRSLNIAAVFGTQDMGMMVRSNPKIARTIFANCSTKILMRSEAVRSDPDLEFLEAFNPADKQPFRASHRGRSWIDRLRLVERKLPPLHDILRELDTGEFLLVHGAHASFCRAPHYRFESEDHVRVKRFFSVSDAAEKIAMVIDPGRMDMPPSIALHPLPAEFEPLVEVSQVGSLPGGHIHLNAALKALAWFSGSKKRMTGRDEFVTLGE